MPQSTTSQELKVTAIDDWDAPEGFVVTLPTCGKNVRVRRTLDMMTQLKAGMIPNPLASIVRKMMVGGASTADDLDMSEFDEKSLQQMLDMTDRTVASAVTEPKLAIPDPKRDDETPDQYEVRVLDWKPPAGTISITRIPMSDRQYIAAIAQGAAVDVVPFRPESSADVADAPDEQAVQEPAQRPARAQRRAKPKQPMGSVVP